MTISTSIEGQLVDLVYRVTDNFCYSCYKVVESSHCPECHSDDFMRHLEGVGVEYGTEWVVESLIKQHCTAIDDEELFDDMMDACYGEINIGCCSWTPSEVLKEMDPTAYRIGVSEHMQSLEEDEQVMQYDGEYYQVSDIEEMIETL